MRGIEKVGIVSLTGPIFFNKLGWDTPVEPDVNGILELKLSETPSAVCFKNGSVLKGIKITNDDGSDYQFDETIEANIMTMVMIRAEDGGVITIINDSLDVLTLENRISVNTGLDMFHNNNWIQVFWETLAPGVRRWRFPDWS